MFSAEIIGGLTAPIVHTTSGRGLNADELTAMAMAKILFVSDQAPPAIREQAAAFKDRIEFVLRTYITQAQKSERTTVCGILEQAGQHDAAALIRKV